MRKYQPYLDFTAQSHNVSALMGLYAILGHSDSVKPPLTAFVVFIAFAIEAYINSVGARNIAFWDDLERLPWRKKLDILHKHSGKVAQWGQQPLQFAVEVFRLRDNLAHGKSERILGPILEDAAEAEKLITSDNFVPKWYGAITESWVLTAKEQFRVLMAYIGQLYGLHSSDHLLQSTGGFLQHGA